MAFIPDLSVALKNAVNAAPIPPAAPAPGVWAISIPNCFFTQKANLRRPLSNISIAANEAPF